MAMPQRDDMIEMLKRPAKWSAEAFGEGGYEVVPPEKEEAFRKMAEEENRRRRPGMRGCMPMMTWRPPRRREDKCGIISTHEKGECHDIT